MTSLRRISNVRLLTSIFLMLVASMFLRPVLNHLGALHGLQHMVQPAAEHGHPHAGDRDAADRDPLHASGGHGVLHQSDLGGSLGILLDVALHDPAIGRGAHPWHRQAAFIAHHCSSLFRPPIVAA